MLKKKKNPFRQNKRYKKCPLFSFVSSNSSQFYFCLWFLYELKHNVPLSKTVREIFHFQFCFVFNEVFIFVQQNARKVAATGLKPPTTQFVNKHSVIWPKYMDSLTLKCHNSFQNENNTKDPHSFAPRHLIFKLREEV